jgi:hypothetical protein
VSDWERGRRDRRERWCGRGKRARPILVRPMLAIGGTGVTTKLDVLKVGQNKEYVPPF